MQRTLALAAACGLAGLCLLPWFGVDYGLFEPDWIEAGGLLSAPGAPALLRALRFHDYVLLVPLGALCVTLVHALADVMRGQERLLLTGVVVALCLAALPPFLGRWLGLSFLDPAPAKALGYGAMVVCASLFFCAAILWARIGKGGRDAFTISVIGLILVLIALFVFYPLLHVGARLVMSSSSGQASPALLDILTSDDIWRASCLVGGASCGAAINSLLLGLATAAGTTVLGLAFALLMNRTRFPSKKLLRALTVLPIITPPFVIGLALILLFGRSGALTIWAAHLSGTEPGRWLYGAWGVWLSQTLAFTPIAFLVLIGVVEGVSPSLEEAASTLRADPSRIMRTICLPLFRPGLANAFLLGFIESLADFGNPLVLGGSHRFLSTEIYFAVVGAQADMARAAALACVLLTFTLAAFLLQRRWLGRKNYTTVTGKGDNGTHALLSPGHATLVYTLTLPWLLFTMVIYGMVLYGSLVKVWGLDHSFTLAHYREAFGIEWINGQLAWTGRAWSSFATTMSLSLLAAPLTAALGLLTAWLLVRQDFIGKQAFEFATMLSFAIPGTVVGVSYILAFNVPPIELTGTGIILVLCFVFRNMPVGVRSGIAAMKQIDRTLDEASLTLGANSLKTLSQIILPLVRPAVVAAIAYSFIRAITSVSAIVFLVSADHNMATSYIVGLVENGNYGVAIAYANVLIAVMLAVVTAVQIVLNPRKPRRDSPIGKALASARPS